ncbi:ArsR/SmtB family transcription factor [Chloroflexus aggregans]|uniref:Transcriptional regulator, ArsR family n=1 Tax=Chloroflexus aggregans (strain MD-66 / DSM 9485) TaxID=326427 RepID=B8G3P9_CHLAD|nr:metalloregulator ArsR/SmtB family transcription factor [Chloroflexus aggregans]ACL23432.1 transcriptional regulator, ArsR family [Chloroflexus aggregans DSM 9485]
MKPYTVANTDTTDESRCCTPITDVPLTDAEATQLADALALLAHPIRLRLLALLARHGGHVCVCDLEASLPVKQPTVSHHLRLLRDGGLIERERRGQWVYYAVRREVLATVKRLIDQFFTHLDG